MWRLSSVRKMRPVTLESLGSADEIDEVYYGTF